MAHYILRDLPADLWERFSARAAEERWAKCALILKLLEDYTEGRIKPTEMPTPLHARRFDTLVRLARQCGLDEGSAQRGAQLLVDLLPKLSANEQLALVELAQGFAEIKRRRRETID